jgi:HSP20 family protein
MLRPGVFGTGFSRNPLREFGRLQEEINRLFPRFADESYAPDFPAVNVWTAADEAVVTAELPGVEAKDIDISVVGDTLTIRGNRTADELKPDESYHRQERGFGEFSRSLRLPFQLNPEQVEAHFHNGVLRVRLPRAEADKPRKISVATA